MIQTSDLNDLVDAGMSSLKADYRFPLALVRRNRSAITNPNLYFSALYIFITHPSRPEQPPLSTSTCLFALGSACGAPLKRLFI